MSTGTSPTPVDSVLAGIATVHAHMSTGVDAIDRLDQATHLLYGLDLDADDVPAAIWQAYQTAIQFEDSTPELRALSIMLQVRIVASLPPETLHRCIKRMDARLQAEVLPTV